MRLLLLIGVLSALVLPARAGEKMTVSQLEQVFARYAQPATNQTSGVAEEIAQISDGDLSDRDDDLIRKIAGIELTERLSTLTMYRLVGKYSLGEPVQQALEQLADRSALLKLPAAEQIPQPAPDADAQHTMLQESRAYVLRELSHLPNFMATQTTTRFDNSPISLKYFQATADESGLHRMGSLQRRIKFEDGKEVTDGGAETEQSTTSQDSGLQSRGEFGGEAAVVLMDVEKGSVVFDHWEQSMAGLAAVFQYSVPRETSHYEVTNACQDHVSFHDRPGYSGEIGLDPKTGAILRMTLVADSKPSDPISHVASVIEYGVVVLGNQRSICPLRSLTFMNEDANGCDDRKLPKPMTMINQTIFSNYHRFGSKATMIFNEAGNSHPAPGTLPRAPATGEEKELQGGAAVTAQVKRP